MIHMLIRRGVLWFWVLLAATVLVGSAQPKTTDSTGTDSLTGQLLVATAEIGDPRFHHAVILLVQHNAEGALGIVLNHPVDERPWASIMQALGEKGTAVAGKLRIFSGGPVQPELGFVLHSAEYRRPGTLALDGQIAVTASRAVLVDMAQGKGPRQALVAFGYAGWGPGQLEREIALHAWFTEPEDPKLVFDVDRDQVWDEATSRKPLSL
jgi:putative transcriptional regulator